MNRQFQLVDVFADGPFSGNPLAVVFDADDLSSSTMLTMARWLNLSETSFLVRPASPRADYAVRIFTVNGELPFAGHPTLGSCHAWLANGGTSRGAEIVQQCEAGLIPIRRTENGLGFAG